MADWWSTFATARLKFANISYLRIYVCQSLTELPNLNPPIIFAMVISCPAAKFNFCQYFLLYGMLCFSQCDKQKFPRECYWNFILQAAPIAEHRLVATWSERGVVSIWDVSKHMLLLDSPSAVGGASGKNFSGHKETPLFTFSGHQVSLSLSLSLSL